MVEDIYIKFEFVTKFLCPNYSKLIVFILGHLFVLSIKVMPQLLYGIKCCLAYNALYIVYYNVKV